MADTPSDTLKPMTAGDTTPPRADAAFKPAAPLKGATFDSDAPGGKFAETRQTLIDNGAKLREQAGDKARVYAEEGKTKASDALGQLSKMLTDAAGNVDEKLGEQYGQYARTAADKVQGFSSSLNDANVDDLIESARDLVRKSPAIAIGAAAAVGFVVARLLTSGLDQRDKV